MAKILSEKRVKEYSVEYKLKVIELTERGEANAHSMSECPSSACLTPPRGGSAQM